MSRPLLVGLHNPLSEDQRYALYPEPEGCTGWRVLQMLKPLTQRDYLGTFDRVNLLEHEEQVGGRGYAARLRQAGGRLLARIDDGQYKYVVLFGADVWRAVLRSHGRDTSPPWTLWTLVRGPDDRLVHFLTLPHPSGRNRWYSDPENRKAATVRLRQLWADSPG